MLVITDIEVIEVPEEQTLIHDFSREPLYAHPHDMPEAVEVTREMVTGRRFRNANGKDLCIGMREDVQEALGMPFEAFENQRRALRECQETTQRLRSEKGTLNSKIKHSGFWKRLKYLFTRKL